MDKKIAGLLGAAAALTLTTSPQAAPAQPTELGSPKSYGDLLKPIPNAVAALRDDEAGLAQGSPAQVELAQFFGHIITTTTIMTFSTITIITATSAVVS